MDTCIYIPVKVGNFLLKISSHIKFNFYGLSFTTWWGIAYKPYIRNAFNSVRWTAMLGAIETSLHVPAIPADMDGLSAHCSIYYRKI